MIGTIDIEVNAAHPSMPIPELCAFVGSPSQVRIRNVPRGVGNWKLTAVYLAVNYPDNTVQAPSCVLTGGIWTATIPGSTATGMSGNGFQVLADGVDEHGDAVTGYVLGAGDVRILPRDGTITVGETAYYYHFLDAVPIAPKKCDTCIIGGVLKWYDGTAWQTFAAGGSSVDVVPPSTDPSASGKAADAKATGDALAGKLTRAEAEAGFTEWNLSGGQGLHDVVNIAWGTSNGVTGWMVVGEEGGVYGYPKGDAQSTSLTWTRDVDADDDYTATRTRLPTMADIPAASSATPQMDGTGAAGSSSAFARGDHVHPSDTSKQDAINDLAAIRSGAAAGATAVQPAALAGAVRYDLPASVTNIADATQEEVEGGTIIYYAEATLADRKANWLVVTTALDELRLTFPAAVSGKVRDFGLRLEISSQLTAPALVLPNGVTMGNPDGAIPEVADGGDNDNGVTLLYFSENAPDKFLVKGEEVKEVS